MLCTHSCRAQAPRSTRASKHTHDQMSTFLVGVAVTRILYSCGSASSHRHGTGRLYLFYFFLFFRALSVTLTTMRLLCRPVKPPDEYVGSEFMIARTKRRRCERARVCSMCANSSSKLFCSGSNAGLSVAASSSLSSSCRICMRAACGCCCAARGAPH